MKAVDPSSGAGDHTTGRAVRRRAYHDGHDRWEIVEADPVPGLTGAVHRYGWWSEETSSFDTRRELASTTGVFIVNLGSDLEIVDAAGTLHHLGTGQGFVGGMARATSLSRSTGVMEGVHVHAPLSTLGRIAGVPPAELGDRVVPLDDLAGRAVRSLGARLQEAADRETLWGMLDDFIADRLSATKPEDPATTYLLARLSSGWRVGALADELGWSRKRLARHVRERIGMEPRAFAGLARFERFAGLIKAQPDTPLAAVAFDAGYADQAHLTREVVRYAQITPGELRRRLIPEGGGVRD